MPVERPRNELELVNTQGKLKYNAYVYYNMHIKLYMWLVLDTVEICNWLLFEIKKLLFYIAKVKCYQFGEPDKPK